MSADGITTNNINNINNNNNIQLPLPTAVIAVSPWTKIMEEDTTTTTKSKDWMSAKVIKKSRERALSGCLPGLRHEGLPLFDRLLGWHVEDGPTRSLDEYPAVIMTHEEEKENIATHLFFDQATLCDDHEFSRLFHRLVSNVLDENDSYDYPSHLVPIFMSFGENEHFYSSGKVFFDRWLRGQRVMTTMEGEVMEHGWLELPGEGHVSP